ncbi:MAG: Smr/MutS family protein [Wenzhouxiangellaceae bacterium]
MSKDDDAIDPVFRDSVGPVRPVLSRRAVSRPPPPRPRPRMREADERQVIETLARSPIGAGTESGDELAWLREGLHPRALRRLRRGYWRIEDEIDLHQMNVAAARRSIEVFLDQSLRHGLRCVKIIHGKGLRSAPDGPKLKGLTERVLRRHPAVLGFASARPSDGGTGAVYVLLAAR